MDLNWPEFLKAALTYGVPILVIALWGVYLRKRRKENESTSEILRKKS